MADQTRTDQTRTEQAQQTVSAPAGEAAAASATIPEPPADKHYFWGTGRRKTAVARVRIRPGEGKFIINKKAHDEYFRLDNDRASILAPLQATETLGKVDVFVNVGGGGTTGQAGAVVLGLARALKIANSQYDHVLRNGGYLTRDARMVERKKYGKAGARRSFQFSKR